MTRVAQRGDPRPRVAYQGAPGAHSEEAARRAFGADAALLPLRSNRDVTRAVADGSAQHGVLPVRNSLAGSVHATHDAILAEPALHVIGLLTLPIHHCVLGVPGGSLEALRAVESHPVALAQCADFFARHPWVEPRAAYDTAGAARLVAEAGDTARGALAGEGAARRYGLQVLARDVEDRPDNQTRFLAVAPAGAAGAHRVAPGRPARTALFATPPNVPGVLVALLAPFAREGLNLSAVESRPTGAPWAYRFRIEVEHAAGDPRLAAALAAAAAAAAGTLRVVGTFSRAAGAEGIA